MSHSASKLLTPAAVVLFVVVLCSWIYSFIYQPLIQGRWLFVISVLGAGLFWAALKEAARRKAESIDYRRH